MEHIKQIINIPEILFKKGVRHTVISAGSRSAPLTLSFVRYKEINTKIIIDERSAAFIALGIAQKTKIPTVLICTSGTAVLNYAPAIAEAYYQKIPLIILTADRPAELIDQFENQSIRQKNIYSNYCIKSFELPDNFNSSESSDFLIRTVSLAFETSLYPCKGPVHINIPLREPIYPNIPNESFSYDKNIKVRDFIIPKIVLDKNDLLDLEKKWNLADKKLILIGQNTTNLDNAILKLKKNNSNVVISDITSNIHKNQEMFFSDILFSTKNQDLKETIKPDILLTYGGQIVSKSIKNFIKTSNIKEHWHIQDDNFFGDPFSSITKIITSNPEYIFEKLAKIENKNNSNYQEIWRNENNIIEKKIKKFFNNSDFNDFYAIYKILQEIPDKTILHLGNSTPIRYANYISMFFANKNITVFSNRGTSGIDGCVSTAVGSALSTNKLVTLIVGDLSFFYDRNALWNNYDLKNLRIIVLNNHGGQIFRMLESSSKLNELDEYFETKNNISIKNTIKDTCLKYFSVDSKDNLNKNLKSFFNKSKKGKIMELELDSIKSISFFNEFKKEFF